MAERRYGLAAYARQPRASRGLLATGTSCLPWLAAVEVKHLRGEIRGSESDATWVQRKIARLSGGAFENPVRNPVGQVKSAAGALRRYLASRGIDIWVEAIVVFTHPEAALRVRSDSVPVVRLPDLARTIAAHPATRPPRQFLDIVEALKALRPAEHHEGKPGLRHVSVFMRDFVTREERLRGLVVESPGPLRRVTRRLKNPCPGRSRPFADRQTLDRRSPWRRASLFGRLLTLAKRSPWSGTRRTTGAAGHSDPDPSHPGNYILREQP